MEEIAIDVLWNRSPCIRIRTGAVIEDKKGRILAWGWNNSGDGCGKHAEDMAMGRANPKRLEGAKLVVAGVYFNRRRLARRGLVTPEDIRDIHKNFSFLQALNMGLIRFVWSRPCKRRNQSDANCPHQSCRIKGLHNHHTPCLERAIHHRVKIIRYSGKDGSFITEDIGYIPRGD